MQQPDDDPGHDVLQCVDTIEYLLPEGKCKDARMPNAAYFDVWWVLSRLQLKARILCCCLIGGGGIKAY